MTCLPLYSYPCSLTNPMPVKTACERCEMVLSSSFVCHQCTLLCQSIGLRHAVRRKASSGGFGEPAVYLARVRYSTRRRRKNRRNDRQRRAVRLKSERASKVGTIPHGQSIKSAQRRRKGLSKTRKGINRWAGGPGQRRSQQNGRAAHTGEKGSDRHWQPLE